MSNYSINLVFAAGGTNPSRSAIPRSHVDLCSKHLCTEKRALFAAPKLSLPASVKAQFSKSTRLIAACRIASAWTPTSETSDQRFIPVKTELARFSLAKGNRLPTTRSSKTFLRAHSNFSKTAGGCSNETLLCSE